MRELTDGSTAIARAALDAGCDFFAGYPITPASPILMMMLAELPKVGGVGIQAEDEIASIGMCIGASMCGARVMTATSGPGISLYSENIGLAIMGEVPLVVVDVQRLGPATGGATTTAQGDVQFVRWGTAGGYPVIALAPSSIPECYELTRKAFELAERFRCPVFLMTDKELNLTLNTVEAETCGGAAPEALERKAVDRGRGSPYRYEPPGAVPPLKVFGDAETPVRFTGSSHDEEAFITKDPVTVGKLNRHLVAKLEEHRDELELVTADLEPRARTLWISYGTTAGAMREAVGRARRDGAAVSALTVQSLWPVPRRAIREALSASDVRRVIVAELNDGQYRREIERLATTQQVEGLHRLDGGLITPEQFLETLH